MISRLLGVLCLALLAGCSAHLENVQPFRGPDFDTIVARGANAQEVVAKHCHRHGAKNWDNGSLMTDRGANSWRRIGACMVPPAAGSVNRKPYIVIPESLLICLDHEQCHAWCFLGLLDCSMAASEEDFCRTHYPCVGLKVNSL